MIAPESINADSIAQTLKNLPHLTTQKNAKTLFQLPLSCGCVTVAMKKEVEFEAEVG